MMRRLFFFAFGLLLGSWCVISFAAPTAAGSRINLNLTPSAPSGVTLSGAWDAVVPGLEDTGYGGYRPGTLGAGSAEIYRGVATRVDGIPLALEAKRGITARNLAKGALGLAKRGGPVGIIGGALVSAGLEWVGDRWHSEPDYIPHVRDGSSWWWETGEYACEIEPGGSGIDDHGTWYYEYVSYYNQTTTPSGYTHYTYCTSKPLLVVGSISYYRTIARRRIDTPYSGPEGGPATDQQIEDALTESFEDGSASPEQALRDVVEQGNAADGDALNGYLEPVNGSGPSFLPGGTSTSVTSSPAGQTTTTTSTGYAIAYGPGGAVGITKSETTTTTTPDGQTTTTDSTQTAAGGQNNKPADEKPFCELYPDAMACQPLGTPSPVELPTGTINVPGLSYESVTAACPSPYTFTPAAGGSYEISWQPVCDGAEAVRPVVIVIGLLTAGVFVFVGMRRGQS